MNPSLYSCFSSLSAWCPITSFLIPPAPHPDERWPTSVRQNRPAEVKVSRPSVRTNSGLKLYLWPTPAAGTSASLQRHRPHSVPSSSPGCWPVRRARLGFTLLSPGLCVRAPQHAFLGPSLYAHALGDLIQSYGFGIISYSDDSPIFISFPSFSSEFQTHVPDCLLNICTWMSNKRFEFNVLNTESSSKSLQ